MTRQFILCQACCPHTGEKGSHRPEGEVGSNEMNDAAVMEAGVCLSLSHPGQGVIDPTVPWS